MFFIFANKNGWPDSQKQLTLGQKPYWKFKEEIHEENGILFFT